MNTTPPSPRWKKLLWFVALWAGGVLTVILVGLVLKWFGRVIF